MIPPRLSETGGAFDVALLRAARADAPAEDGPDRALRAIAIGAAAGALGASATKVVVVRVLKVLAAGGGVLALATSLWLGPGASRAPFAPSSMPAIARKEAPPARAFEDARDVLALPPPTASPLVNAPAPAAARRRATPPSSGAEREDAPPVESEIALLARTKNQLEAHDASAALATLDGYARTYRAGSLAEEAAVLRVDALFAAGREAPAIEAAKRFLSTYPLSAYGARVREALFHAELERESR